MSDVQPFTRVESVAVALLEANIDTDLIFPARFLLLTDRAGLGAHLFHDRRRLADGGEDPSFPLNRAERRAAAILVAGDNFGCGSSREHAVWALVDRGFRVVIAPGFAEIFFANCLRNGLLPIAADQGMFGKICAAAERADKLSVDLGAQSISLPDGTKLSFAVDAGVRDALLNGWDETELILNRDGDDIAAFEDRQRDRMPWLYAGETRAASGVRR